MNFLRQALIKLPKISNVIVANTLSKPRVPQLAAELSKRLAGLTIQGKKISEVSLI